jgi:excisionase family DNA binding protein
VASRSPRPGEASDARRAGSRDPSRPPAITEIRLPTPPPRGMDRLLAADELAERLGMKTEWVWAQARAGRIPHVRLGRYRRFRESAVEERLREIETGGIGRATSPQSRPIPLRRRA